MSDVDDILDEVGNARPHSGFSRNYVKEGDHDLELKSIVFKKSRQGKKLFAADFVVVGSQAHKPGETVTVSWKMSHHPEPWQLEQDQGRLNAFVSALLGPAFLGEKPSADKIKAALRDLIGPNGSGTAQPGRGIRVRASGIKVGEKFVDVTFENVAGQTAETIRANRARQESGAGPVTATTRGAADATQMGTKPAAEEPKTEAAPSGLGSMLGL